MSLATKPIDAPPHRSVRVLHVIASVNPRSGGPIEGVFSSSEVWFRHGHERHIVCLDPPSAPWLAQARAPTEAIGPDGRLYAALRRMLPWLRYGYSPRLRTWLRAHAGAYDAVIVNGLWNYASLGAWRALRGLSVPYYVFPHGISDQLSMYQRSCSTRCSIWDKRRVSPRRPRTWAAPVRPGFTW